MKSINNEIVTQFLGLLDYSEALKAQYRWHQKVSEQNVNVILGVEHPSVLTLGYRADESQEVLNTGQIPVVKVERGGLATIHSEGQLVIYPLVNLRSLKLGVRDYVSLLLKTTQILLSDFEIESHVVTEPVTGLFTKNGKIAFCGIQIKNGISLHGISLNVKNDLSLFNHIIPCGISQQKMDRITHYKEVNDLGELFNRWCEIFNYNMKEQQQH